jgi:alpha-galactosidase
VSLRKHIGIALLVLTCLYLIHRMPFVRADSRATYASQIQTRAKRATADFDVDADLKKEVWKNAQWVEFDHDASGRYHYPELVTRVASAWSDSYVYFAFSCRFDNLNVYEGEDISKERWELWNRDVAEVFVNPQPDRITHYYEFEVAPNNQWIDLEIEKTKNPFNDAAWNSEFSHASKVDSQKRIWATEMRIPLRSMNVAALRTGSQWRVNFFRAAGQGNDKHRKFLAWSVIPSGTTFHVPERFGILEIID